MCVCKQTTYHKTCRQFALYKLCNEFLLICCCSTEISTQLLKQLSRPMNCTGSSSTKQQGIYLILMHTFMQSDEVYLPCTSMAPLSRMAKGRSIAATYLLVFSAVANSFVNAYSPFYTAGSLFLTTARTYDLVNFLLLSIGHLSDQLLDIAITYCIVHADQINSLMGQVQLKSLCWL